MKITFCLWALWLAAFRLSAAGAELTVARDGSAPFRLVSEALAAVPKREAAPAAERWIIHVRPGIYREKLVVPHGLAPVTLVGEDSTGTILTGEDFAGTASKGGEKLGTFGSAATSVLADDFAAENLTFQNAHGAGSQAVALRVAAERVLFRHCHILGWQDTLLLQEGRQYFEDCLIEGTVDFIFGGATAYFEHCELKALGDGFITAASTPEEQRYGFVFSNCRVAAEKGAKVFLGRPWKEYGAVTFLRAQALEGVPPEGWHNWNDPTREMTARFAEFPRHGAEGTVQARAAWAKRLTEAEAAKITVAAVLGGQEHWDPAQMPSAISPSAMEWGVAPSRIATLPSAEREPWEKYRARSDAALAHDREVLEEEMKSAGLTEPLAAPGPDDFKLPAHDADWFGSAEAIALAEVMVSFQTPAGGWAKQVRYDQGARRPGMHWISHSAGVSWFYVGTIDNGQTTGQIEALAKFYQATKREAFRDSVLKGLRYLLAAQFPSGGWPQVYPLSGLYHDAITFNDDAMIHVLDLLQRVAESDSMLDFAAPLRDEAAQAVERGVHCLLASQLSQDGTKAVWCAQHDPITLEAVSARLKEPASLSGGESMGILRFLMKRPHPGPGETEVIEQGLAWFERSKLYGWRPVKRDGRNLWEQTSSTTDPMWARFNDLHTNQPVFAGAQDGIVYDSFETMARNNQFGYTFFTPKPQELLTREQAKWRARK